MMKKGDGFGFRHVKFGVAGDIQDAISSRHFNLNNISRAQLITYFLNLK